jgi:hypothetical protein
MVGARLADARGGYNSFVSQPVSGIVRISLAVERTSLGDQRLSLTVAVRVIGKAA